MGGLPMMIAGTGTGRSERNPTFVFWHGEHSGGSAVAVAIRADLRRIAPVAGARHSTRVRVGYLGR